MQVQVTDQEILARVALLTFRCEKLEAALVKLQAENEALKKEAAKD